MTGAKLATKVRVTTVGNSTGIVLPKELLSRLKVGSGDTVIVSETPDGLHLTAYEENFLRKLAATEK
jgi:putative addiction module antidote